MKADKRLSLLAAGLLAAGCASVPTVAPEGDPFGLGDAISPRYTAQAVHLDDVAITRLEASSTRPTRWFSTGHLTDGNLHSAWGPAHDDASPTLLVTLSRPTTLSALGLKVSDRDITFDVAAATTEGGFTTVATGVRPDYTSLDLIDLPDVEAVQLKLTFHVPADRRLLVCELELFNADGAVTAPAPTATPAPSDSQHFFVEGAYGPQQFGPFRFRRGQNGYMLSFKSHVPEAETRFRAQVRTADGAVVTEWDYERLRSMRWSYDRNYALYGTFSIDHNGGEVFLGRDCYFEVLEATGTFRFILANDKGYITDAVR